jgi:hypothetical protein
MLPVAYNPKLPIMNCLSTVLLVFSFLLVLVSKVFASMKQGQGSMRE